MIEIEIGVSEANWDSHGSYCFFALGRSKAASGSHVLMLSLQLEYHREPPGGRKVEELSISAFKKK